MHKNEGFTLLELLVVVAVIGILAAVSMPYYNDYITRGKLAEGTSALADARIKMEQYFQDNRTYLPTTTTAANGCPTNLAVPATTTYFSLTCTGLSLNTYIISAVGGNATNTSLAGWTYTINQLNQKGTTAPAGWALASGNPAGCWVVKKKSC